MATELPYREALAWYASFSAAPTGTERRNLAHALPAPLSGGWARVATQALKLAREASQRAPADVLERRLATAERPNQAPSALESAVCTGCGERKPLDAFGLRYMVRATRPKTGDIAASPGDKDPRRPVNGVPRPPLPDGTWLLRVRQAQCTPCRGLPGVPDALLAGVGQ